MIGIIGGSGLYAIEGIVMKKAKKITTPFGKPSDAYMIGEIAGREVVFLPRHGSKHAIPPHRINYRANIWGFSKLGVKQIISFGATGGIRPDMKPGTIVVPDQVIDMTQNRESTFYNGRNGVVHIDFTEPFCPELRMALFSAGRKTGVKLKKSGTYICTQGPRLETKAEIRFFSAIGGDMVGMTLMPEATLAREAELCYTGVAVVTNYAAGIKAKRLTVSEVLEVMQKTSLKLRALLKETFPLIPSGRTCACTTALRDAKV